MNTSPFSDDSSATHLNDNHPYDVHSTATASTATATEPVDWPKTREIRALLQCGDPNCRCRRENSNVHCPACAHRTPSLSVDDAPNSSENGVQSLWFCQSGCSQDAVTKALHKLVFEGPDPTNAGTSSGDHVANAAAPRAPKTLRQRGINLETRNYFELQEYASLGVIMPTFYLDGVRGPVRIKAAYPNGPKYRWRDQTPSGENEGDRAEIELPSIYNADVIHAAARMEAGLFITKSEAETWTMHQAGLAAVCLLGDKPDFQPLVAMLRANGIKRVVAIFGNDLLGRRSAIRLREVCEATNTDDFKVAAVIRLIESPLGFDLGDLFAQVKFNARKFHQEIEQLPFVPGSLLDAWRQHPEVGLPDPVPETSSDDESEGGLDLLPHLNEDELARIPVPECVVEGLILESRPTLFTSQNNVGKSALAVDFCCVSLGIPWNGRETKQGATFYLAAEGADGIGKRHLAWKQHHGIAKTPDFHTLPAVVTLTDPAGLSRLIRTIKHFNCTGKATALVVIDTLSICSGGADENLTADMAKFVSAAQQICTQTGAATLILHHNNRGESFRGSSVLPDNCYGHLTLAPTKGLIKLSVAKIKDFDHRQHMLLRGVTITLDNRLDSKGKPVTSVVFVPTNASESAFKGETDEAEVASKGSKPFAKSNPFGKPAKLKGELSEKVQATWQALLALNANGAAGVASGEWAAKAKELGVSGATFERAKKKLQDLGKVEREESGKGGARFTAKL